MNRRIVIYIVLFLVVAVGGVAFILLSNQEDETALPNVFDQTTAFEVRYPDAWIYQIPTANVFLLAPSPVLDEGSPGPSVTIQRTTPFGAGSDVLEDILAIFLERNQLTGEDTENWQQVGEVRETEISGQPALTVDYRGSTLPDDPISAMEISVTLSQTGEIVYFVFASAPETLWVEFEETIHAIIDSMVIKE